MLRRRLILALSGLAAVVMIGLLSLTFIHTAGADDLVKAPENLLLCGTCHTMEQEVVAWQANAHKTVACLECHSEEDPGWVRHEFVDRSGDMAANAANAHPLELKVVQTRCEECHAAQMDDLLKDITPKPILASTKAEGVGQPMATKALHNKHINGDAKLQCVDCHAQDAHGPAEGTVNWREATHKVCLDCHEQKQVKIAVAGSTSCSACHVDVAQVTPADHKDKTAWKKAHGDASINGSCGECHLSSSAGPHTQLSNASSFPTATKDACASCHSGVQMPHPDGFLATHGKVSLTTGISTCESCHTPDSKATAATGGAASCNSCHATAMPHPDGFLAKHGDAASANPSSCTTCHSPANVANPGADHAAASYCYDCHLQPMPHPDSFLSAHGAEAKKAPATCDACHSPLNVARPSAPHANAGYCATCHDSYEHETGWVASHGTNIDESCATCHTLQGQPGQHNACSACHTGSGEWHPNMWFVTHAREVEAKGEESCMTCHNEVKPSCSQCHRDR